MADACYFSLSDNKSYEEIHFIYDSIVIKEKLKNYMDWRFHSSMVTPVAICHTEPIRDNISIRAQ